MSSFAVIFYAQSPVERYTAPTKHGRSGVAGKRAIIALVERGGNVRWFHVAFADKRSVAEIVGDNVARETRLHTDESRLYTEVGAEFAAHETVRHSAKSMLGRRPHEHDRGRVLNLQAWHARRLPALPLEASASVSR
jgi:ISXO2-like transposase domain